MFTDYQETLDFLFSRLPMFQNIGANALTKDLTNTIKLLEFIGNPHQTTSTKWIHIGGTNGKGSTSSMLAAIFTANGYKTGLYTSPHLVDFRERIRINGIVIPESFVIDFTNKIKDAIEIINPSFFEMTVAMAFDYFRSESIEVGIIEVGLGGRLDSTNVISPILSAITSIGFDHMDILGNTIEAIAGEKAGIIKTNVPFLLGDMPEAALNTILNYGTSIGGNYIAKESTPDKWLEKISLKGIYQKSNLNVVYNIVLNLRQLDLKLDEDKCIEGLSQVNKLSGLRGRWEIINTSPLTICDTGHNKDGVEMILQQLQSIQKENQKIHFVWGMVKDKDISGILSMLPKDAKYYACKPNVIRGLDSAVLAESMKKYNLGVSDCASVYNAYLNASQIASQNNDIVFIGGSTFVVGDLLKELN
jgi:dihydrofolate synthase / folylpolyglutamate synthase